MKSFAVYCWGINLAEDTPLKYLFSYLKKYRVESFLAPLFKMLEAFFDLRVPMIVARIINTGINGEFVDEAARMPYILGQCKGFQNAQILLPYRI